MRYSWSVCRTLKVLDLFCGIGGAGMGYHRAGFSVTGVDNEPQPFYPFSFIHADAFEYAKIHAAGYDLIHASPPCQYYSRSSGYHPAKYYWPGDPGAYPDLLTAALALLQNNNQPYVVENVSTASYVMSRPVILCGTMFGLKLYRHRAFETSFTVARPAHPKHTALVQRNSYQPTAERPFMTITGRNGHHSRAWVRTAAEYMGMPWAATDQNGLIEAVPPAYTEHIGSQYLASLEREAA